MNQDQTNQPRPEDFGDIGAPAPGWPKVIGVLSIVWAAIGLFCGVLGAVFGVFGRQFMENAAEGGPLPPNAQFSTLQWAALGVGVVFGVVLIAAGIATAARKASGRTLHLMYALAGLALTCVNVFLALQGAKQMKQWVADNPDSPFAQGYSETGQLISMAIGIGIGAAWPLFCIVWFGMLNKRPEQDAPEITA